MNWIITHNPYFWLAGQAGGKLVTDGWTMAMLGIWNAGLWFLRLVLKIEDAFLVPDISENGPGATVYQITFWIAGALVLLMLMIQLGVAAVRRDSKSIARAVMGSGQFAIVWTCWVSGAVLVLAAAGGLTTAMMNSLLKVDSWGKWHPFASINTKDIVDGTVATVLGFLGALLFVAAIGHLMVMLARAGAVLVLATTSPISAAGLVAEVGRSWFWKSLRWFIAAALSPVIMVLVIGIGVQLTTGVATGMTDQVQAAIGTAVPGVLLILISCFCPLALFKLLAFVEPGTTSGAAMRAGFEAQGGLQGLLGGQSASETGSSAASSADNSGASQGEASSQDDTSNRFVKALSGMGGVAGMGLGAMQSIGTRGASIGADLTNQMGVGHSGYFPDFSAGKQQRADDGRSAEQHQGSDGDSAADGDSGGGSSAGPTPTIGGNQPTDPAHVAPSQGMPGAVGGQAAGGAGGGSTPKPPGGAGEAGGAGGAASEAAVVAV